VESLPHPSKLRETTRRKQPANSDIQFFENFSSRLSYEGETMGETIQDSRNETSAGPRYGDNPDIFALIRAVYSILAVPVTAKMGPMFTCGRWLPRSA